MADGKPWTAFWQSLSEDQHIGWTSTFAEAQVVRKKFQIAKSLTFVCLKKPANFGNNICLKTLKARLRFESPSLKDIAPFDGVPFVVLGKMHYGCLYGKDTHKSTKAKLEKIKEEAEKSGHPLPYKPRTMIQPSKKKDCPARLELVEIIRYPGFKLNQDTQWGRRVICKHVRDLLERGGDIKTEHRIYIRLPRDEDHQNSHTLNQLAGLKNPLDKSVRDKIHELVVDGVSSIAEMRRCLRIFVDGFSSEDLRPATTDEAYYPNDKTLRNHIYSCQHRLGLRSACQKTAPVGRSRKRAPRVRPKKEPMDVDVTVSQPTMQLCDGTGDQTLVSPAPTCIENMTYENIIMQGQEDEDSNVEYIILQTDDIYSNTDNLIATSTPLPTEVVVSSAGQSNVCPVESVGNGADSFQCGVCFQLVHDITEFLHHKSTHVDQSHVLGCELCGMSYSLQRPLLEHYRLQHNVTLEAGHINQIHEYNVSPS